MDAPLFRPQALDARRSAVLGETLQRAPVGSRAFTLIAVAVLIAGATFVSAVELPRRATVRGYLAPEHGLAKVRATVGATVVELLVREGDQVTEGQILARLELPRATLATDSVGAATLAELGAVRRDLESQRHQVQAGLEAEFQTLGRRTAALTRESAQIKALLSVAHQRTLAAQQKLADLAPLVAQGLVPGQQHSQQLDRVEELRLEELRLEQSSIEKTHAIAEVAAEQESRARAARIRLAEISTALDRLALETLATTADQSPAVRAPLAGTVLRIAVQPGSTVMPGQVIAVISPPNSRLDAVLLVPLRDAGLLATGQEVLLRLDAFPYQRFGIRRARIRNIAGSARLAGEGQSPLEPSEPTYQATATLDAQRMFAYGSAWPLRTDLTFDADIVLERVTLIERVLDPLRAFTRRGG